MNSHELFEVIGYLCNPIRQCKLDAEMRPIHQEDFENRYRQLSGNNPNNSNQNYYILDQDANKWGPELRIYFIRQENVPEQIAWNIRTSRPGDIYNVRINNNELFWNLIQYGFLLSDSQNEQRIRNRIPTDNLDDFERRFQIL